MMPARRIVVLSFAWAVYFASRVWLLLPPLFFGRSRFEGLLPPHTGGNNLGFYAYFAEVVAAGRDPYTLVGGPVKPYFADYPPFLMAVFGAFATVMPGRVAVLTVCYLGDLMLWLLALRLASTRTRLDKLFTLALVLVNPLYLATQLQIVEYKAWIAAGFVALYMTHSALILGLMSGAFVLPALLIPLQLLRDRDWRATGIAIAVAALTWLPFVHTAAPAVFGRRAERANMTTCAESIASALPASGRAWFLVLGVVLAAACLMVRRNPVLQAAAALSIVVALAPDATTSRFFMFTLSILIAAPMSGNARAGAFTACLVAYAAREWRWASGPVVWSIPAWLLIGMYLPTALAIWFAVRPESPSAVSRS